MISRSNRIALAVAIAVLSMIALPLVYAATATDYSKRIPIVITNGLATTLDYPVCALVNPPGLITAGFLQADALDAAAFDVAESEISLTRQDPTSAADCWWIGLPQDLLAGQTDTSYLHVDAATPGSDNPNSLFVQGPLEKFEIPDAAIYDDVTAYTAYIGTFTLDSVGTEVKFWDKGGQGEFGVSAGGFLFGTITCTSGACAPASPITFTGTTPIVAGTEYGGAWFSVDLSGTTTLFLDGNQESTSNPNGAMTVNATANTLWADATGQFDSFKWRDFVPLGGGNPNTFAWDREFIFTPANVDQTQEGNSGNSWTWLGTVIDTDIGTYTFIRDLSSVTVDVQALQSKTSIPLIAVSPTLGDFIPDLPDLSIQEATGTFTGLDTLERAINQIDGQNDGFLLLSMIVVGAFLGGAVAAGTKFAGLGVGVMAIPITLGGPFGWYAWGWVALSLILIFVVSGLIAAVGRR